jgi:hypothetical protein
VCNEHGYYAGLRLPNSRLGVRSARTPARYDHGREFILAPSPGTIPRYLMERFTTVNEAPRKRSASLDCNNSHSEVVGGSCHHRGERLHQPNWNCYPHRLNVGLRSRLNHWPDSPWRIGCLALPASRRSTFICGATLPRGGRSYPVSAAQNDCAVVERVVFGRRFTRHVSEGALRSA